MSWILAGPALLFCPADRPERFQKAAAASDVVILDLEDGVGANDRVAAREALIATPLDPARTIVRVNPVGTPDHARDIEALGRTSYDTVMLAKSESSDQVNSLAPRNVIALCETPAGVVRACEIAAASSTVGLMWGAEDLVAGLHGRSSRLANGAYRDIARTARSLVLLAAGAFARYSIDTVHLAIADLEGLRAEAIDGAESGFDGTACIHPSQVPVVRSAYRPTDVDFAWATRVIEAARHERGVFSFEGQMVDAPVLHQAERIVEHFGRYGS